MTLFEVTTATMICIIHWQSFSQLNPFPENPIYPGLGLALQCTNLCIGGRVQTSQVSVLVKNPNAPPGSLNDTKPS